MIYINLNNKDGMLLRPPPKPDKRPYKTYLKRWNYAVATVHSSSFIALTVISFVRLATPGLTRFVNVWSTGVTSGPVIGMYPIFATLIPFPLITAIFHVLAACNVGNYYKEVLFKGYNRLKWIEYGITNGLMSWSVIFVAGNGANFWIAISAVVSNLFMQYCGYKHESTAGRPWGWFLVGFLPWIFNWTWVFVVFGSRISTASVSDGFSIIGTFVWSFAFVLPLIWRKLTKTSAKRANYLVERAYVLLSLSAKLWLDWTVTIGTLVELN